MAAVLSSAVVGWLGVTGTAATLVAGGVQIGVGLAVTAALSGRARSGRGGLQESPQDGRVLGQNTTAPRVRIYGQGVYSGQMVFQRAAGGFLHRIIVHGQGPIDRIVETRLAQRQVGVESDGRVFTAPYAHGEIGSLIRIETRLGTVDQVAVTGPMEVAPEWSAAHRLRGLAYTWVRFEQRGQANQLESYPTGVPALQHVLRGANDILDPRTGHRSYTDNAALVIADWIAHPDGFDRPGAFHLPTLIEAANMCDLDRPLVSGGSTTAWRLSGATSLVEEPEAGLRRKLEACGGDLWLRPDGLIGISVGGDPDPVITLTEDDLLGAEDYDDGPGALERYTELPITYVDEAMDYIETTAEPWRNVDEENRIGKTVIAAPVDLRYAPNHAQARHAAEIKSVRDNPPERLRVRLSPSGLPVIYERTVNVDMPSLGLDGRWRVRPWTVSAADLSVTVELSKIAGDPRAWSVAKEGAPQLLPIKQPTDDGPPSAPLDVQAFGQAAGLSAGIYVTGIAPKQDGVEHYFAYRETGTTSWIEVSTPASAGSNSIGALTEGQSYDIAVIAARTAIYDPGSPDVSDVIVTGVVALDTVPVPAAPTGLVISESAPGVALVEVTSSVSAFQRWTEIRRNGVPVALVRAAPGQSVQVADACGAGTFAWSARALSLSETPSAAVELLKTIK